MKKVIALIASIVAVCILAVSLVGCSSASPQDVTTATLDEIKAQDFEGNMAELKTSIEQGVKEAAGTDVELTDDEQAVVNKLLNKMCDFDYTLGDASVDGDHASVPVTFTTYDIKGTFTSSMRSYLQNVYASALSTGTVPSQQEIVAQYFSELSTAIDALEEKSVTAQGTITLTKTDGAWTVDELDSTTLNAMFGGIVDVPTEMSSIGNEFISAN